MSPRDPLPDQSDVPRDSRNAWRVIDALGVWREVASARNAVSKAIAFDRVCPARECPHRVEFWNGAQWAALTAASDQQQHPTEDR